MTDKPLVSILSPCYNVEKFLPKCLDSIINQTYSNLQIVMIDDGSKDGTWGILQEYAAKDSRIEISHQENQGVATARNVLLSKIKGDYFLFVDSDDWIEPLMVEYLLSRAIAYKAEMVTCGMVMNDDVPTTVAHEKSCSQDEVVKEFLRHVSFTGSLCNKLSSVRLLKNKPRFNPKISYGEDALFCWELLKEAKTVVVTDRQLYHYRMNDASLSHISWTPEKKGSCHIVWNLIATDAEKLWPQYADIAKARHAIEDMWGLYYASLSNYPYDEEIKKRQENIRKSFNLMRTSGLISLSKLIFAWACSRKYNLWGGYLGALKKCITGVKELYKKIIPFPYIFRWINKKRLKNENVTILTMNCFAGILYHNLGLQFCSPTVNVRFEDIRQFYKFCSNLNFYLTLDLEETVSSENYPVAKLGDLTLHLVHYKSVAEAAAKWNSRKTRINFDNIYVIANDYVSEKEMLSKDEIVAFGKLPYKTIVLTQIPYKDLSFTYYMGSKKLSKLMNTNAITGLRGYETTFDVVKFLNS